MPKVKLTEFHRTRSRPEAKPFLFWDTTQKGLALQVRPNRYREEYAKEHNKSYKQADYLVRKHLIPRWGKLLPAHITRDDVKSMMKAISAPVVANQTLAAASAIFSWALKESVGGVTLNPCILVKRNKTKDRERVLYERELPQFWAAFEQAGMA